MACGAVAACAPDSPPVAEAAKTRQGSGRPEGLLAANTDDRSVDRKVCAIGALECQSCVARGDSTRRQRAARRSTMASKVPSCWPSNQSAVIGAVRELDQELDLVRDDVDRDLRLAHRLRTLRTEPIRRRVGPRECRRGVRVVFDRACELAVAQLHPTAQVADEALLVRPQHCPARRAGNRTSPIATTPTLSLVRGDGQCCVAATEPGSSPSARAMWLPIRRKNAPAAVSGLEIDATARGESRADHHGPRGPPTARC